MYPLVRDVDNMGQGGYTCTREGDICEISVPSSHFAMNLKLLYKIDLIQKKPTKKHNEIRFWIQRKVQYLAVCTLVRTRKQIRHCYTATRGVVCS